MYNDEKPDSGQSSYYGHTKGMLLTNYLLIILLL